VGINGFGCLFGKRGLLYLCTPLVFARSVNPSKTGRHEEGSEVDGVTTGDCYPRGRGREVSVSVVALNVFLLAYDGCNLPPTTWHVLGGTVDGGVFNLESRYGCTVESCTNMTKHGPCAVGSEVYEEQVSRTVSFSLSLVLGHVLSPVRFLPRHSLLLIANYTSEHVCRLRPSAIFGKPLPHEDSFV
jgi:hypothetical protein